MSTLFINVIEAPRVQYLCFVVHPSGVNTYHMEPMLRPSGICNRNRTFHIIARSMGSVHDVNSVQCLFNCGIYPAINNQKALNWVVQEFLHLNFICAYEACDRGTVQSLAEQIRALLRIQNINEAGRLRVVIPFTTWVYLASDKKDSSNALDWLDAIGAFVTLISSDEHIHKLQILLDFGTNSVMDAVKDEGISKEVREWFQAQVQKADMMLHALQYNMTPENVVFQRHVRSGWWMYKTDKSYPWVQSNIKILRPAHRDAEMIQRQQFLYDQTPNQREFYWPYCSLSEMIRTTMLTDAKPLPE